MINGLLASLQTPALRDKIWVKPKEAFLVDLVQKYGGSYGIGVQYGRAMLKH